MSKKSRNALRELRHERLRKVLKGNAEKPRFSVFRSLKNLYVQIIDDERSVTLTSASTVEKSLKNNFEAGTSNINAALTLGKIAAERALKLGIKQVVFDRGGHAYHGKVKAIADGAREGGLIF